MNYTPHRKPEFTLFIPLIFSLFFSWDSFGQSALITVLSPNDVTLTNTEQTKLTQIQGKPYTSATWHLQMGSIENSLQGATLTLQIPDVAANLTFFADYVNSQTNGNYYWTGYNNNGNTFRIGKAGSEYLGGIYIANTDAYYSIQNLSDNKVILVKHAPGYLNSFGDCDNLPTADQDSDDTVTDRSSCETNTIRVLVLFTPASLTNTAGFNPVMVGTQIITELNAACIASGLNSSDVKFVSAGYLPVPITGFAELPSAKATLMSYSANPSVIALRNSSAADVVILITGDVFPFTNGVSLGIGVSESDAFSLVTVSGAANAFSGTHEIGHLLGGRHQRCIDCDNDDFQCDNATNAHGYKISNANSKTIMRQIGCDGNRVGRWSNPDGPLFMGHVTGTNIDNNAKKIKDRAGKVSCFRGAIEGQPLEVSIKGSHTVCIGDDGQTYSATYNINNFVQPVTTLWDVSPNGIGSWVNISTCNSSPCILTNLSTLPTEFFIRVRIVGADGNFASDMMKVKQVDCFGGGNDDRSRVEENNLNLIVSSIKIHPMPVSDQIVIDGLYGQSSILIFDLNGKLVFRNKIDADQEISYTVSVSEFQRGMYTLTIVSQDNFFTTKLVKL